MIKQRTRNSIKNTPPLQSSTIPKLKQSNKYARRAKKRPRRHRELPIVAGFHNRALPLFPIKAPPLFPSSVSGGIQNLFRFALLPLEWPLMPSAFICEERNRTFSFFSKVVRSNGCGADAGAVGAQDASSGIGSVHRGRHLGGQRGVPMRVHQHWRTG